MLIDEYRKSLKMQEAEELFDTFLYRPLAYLLVKVIHRMPITPNQVTGLSLLAGLIAAYFFSKGTPTMLMWGAAWYACANILDCADGQLARVQKSGTLLGRVLDGLADYISSGAVFFGIGIGLASSGNSMWAMVLIAGLSSAVHAIFFDRHQSEFIALASGQKNFLEREREQFTEELRHRKEKKERGIGGFLIILYLWYLELQKKINLSSQRENIDSEFYRNANASMIRLWSFLGPTTNRTLLIACAVIGKIELYLWGIVIVGNAWLVLCHLFQRQRDRKFEASSRVQAETERLPR